MRVVICLLFGLCLSPFTDAQRVFKKGEVNEKSLRKEAKMDKMVMNYGIQFNFGPTYMMTGKTKSYNITDNSGARGVYSLFGRELEYRRCKNQEF